MKLTVIIVSYNVKHYLRQCIDSVAKAIEGLDAEVCVVDNHSKDGTVEYINEHCKNVKMIAANHNYGFARANNIAIRQSESEFVLLLNPDTIVGEDTIRECLAFMDAHSDAGGLGVRMLKCDGSDALESRRGLPSPMTAFYKMCSLCEKFPESRRFGKYYMGYLPWDEPAQIEVVSGAFFMLRREALDKAGLLDEDFFMYGEDIDLSYRLLKAGYHNWYLPAKILHYKGESTQKSSFRYVHVFYEAMLIFLRKHYGHLSFWLSIPIKSAIYVKAFMALVNMQYSSIRKMLGMSTKIRKKMPSYIFIGNKAAISRCRKLAANNGLSAQFFVGDEISMPDGHQSLMEKIDHDTLTYVVYDKGSYKYKTILRNFSTMPMPNLLIGTYDATNNIIITDKEIII